MIRKRFETVAGQKVVVLEYDVDVLAPGEKEPRRIPQSFLVGTAKPSDPAGTNNPLGLAILELLHEYASLQDRLASAEHQMEELRKSRKK